MLKKLAIAILALFSASALFAGSVELIGAGATFPYPLYNKMFSTYKKDKGTVVNYQAIGSGGGIQSLISKTVDFAGSDAPMNDKEAKSAKADVVHVPTCLGAVVLSYNLPGNPKLKLNADIVAGIYLGKIVKWNDPAIVAENAGITLPDLPIVVVRRADSSGTTYTFTDYLSAVSAEWKAKIGVNKSPNWPGTTMGGKGNPGVAGYVKKTPGAIGYVEIAYAKQNNMVWASLKNSSGNYFDADLASIAAAADVDLPADTKVSLVDTKSPNGYPICTFTWILLYKEQAYGGHPQNRAQETVKLLWWMTHEGQAINETLDYGKLPPKALAIVENQIKSVVYNGQPIQK